MKIISKKSPEIYIGQKYEISYDYVDQKGIVEIVGILKKKNRTEIGNEDYFILKVISGNITIQNETLRSVIGILSSYEIKYFNENQDICWRYHLCKDLLKRGERIWL